MLVDSKWIDRDGKSDFDNRDALSAQPDTYPQPYPRCSNLSAEIHPSFSLFGMHGQLEEERASG